MNILKTVTDLSHRYGTTAFVEGGGGNTSAKDAHFLWVKPSGTSLLMLKPESFVKLDRAVLASLTAPVPAGVSEAAFAQSVLDSAMTDPAARRPSVEAPLHNLLPFRYVVHTHPYKVNGLTCATDGREAARRIVPTALWLDYVPPGYALSVAVHRAVEAYRSEHGKAPSIILLQNHGVFVADDSAVAIDRHYRELMARLDGAYSAADVDPQVYSAPPPSAVRVAAVKTHLFDVLGEDTPFLAAAGDFPVADAAPSPEHIVGYGPAPFQGELTSEHVAAYRARYGVHPQVIRWQNGVWARGKTSKEATLALALALDAARIRACAKAFGGIRYLSPDETRNIMEWEAESYRKQQMV